MKTIPIKELRVGDLVVNLGAVESIFEYYNVFIINFKSTFNTKLVISTNGNVVIIDKT